MKNFDYNNPTRLVFGRGTVENIGKYIAGYGDKKVLLLYGKGSIFANGTYDKVTKSLRESGIDFIELGGVKPNPVLTKVREAVELMKKEKVDGIVPVGGGSVFDTAKACAAGYFYDGDVWDLYEGKAKVTKALPIYGVLTISATGSEMNHNSVIMNEEEKKKWGLGSRAFYPRLSIVDPSVQATLPRNQTVNGACDTLAHVFEAYFGGTPSTRMQDELSEGIMRTTIDSVRILLDDPSDYDARAELAWAATLALNGLNGLGRAGDWASHGIEHSLSAFTDIAHGEGLAIIFPAWMKHVYREDPEKFARFGEKVLGIDKSSAEDMALKAIEALKDFFRSIGAPVTLRERGFTEDMLEPMAENAVMKGSLGTLKKLGKEDVMEILKIAF
jgi:hypothetical protein